MKRTIETECYICWNSQKNNESANIKCNNPPFSMQANPDGYLMGRFDYPTDFDPKFKRQFCDNFKPVSEEDHARYGECGGAYPYKVGE